MEEEKKKYYIKVKPDGPYLVYGNPPIDQEIIIPNEDGISWLYQKGIHFEKEPKADGRISLCRCGVSKNHPFCDGAHKHIEWDSKENSNKKTYEEEAQKFVGPEYTLEDNDKYCVGAQFCFAGGEAWDIVAKKNDKEQNDILFHEVSHCPSGRLVLRKRSSGEIVDYPFPPSLAILEQPGLKISGPIWVKGGITIVDEDGKAYEVRNRVTLCRCGHSKNKPFCDTSHIRVKFNDGLPTEGKGEKW